MQANRQEIYFSVSLSMFGNEDEPNHGVSNIFFGFFASGIRTLRLVDASSYNDD